MSEPDEVRALAGEIIEQVEREFTGATLELDFDHPRQEHEDAVLWVTAPDDDDEAWGELWGFVIGLVQEAFQQHDVYLVARPKGRQVVLRERATDKE